MGGGAGNDWRVQLADYASSRLKDEEMMRCQADLRAARAEIERLNNVVRQAQSRAADDIRREQVHCAAASFTRWTNPSQMTRAGPAPGRSPHPLLGRLQRGGVERGPRARRGGRRGRRDGAA